MILFCAASISSTRPGHDRVVERDGETHDYLYTNAALAAGLPNVSPLTQEKITGRTADPIYLNRSHWTANDAGSRIGQSSGSNAQIGVDTQLAVHYNWGVNGRLHQLDATFADSFGSGTPAVSHWRAAYEFGNAAQGNLLTRLLLQRAYKVGGLGGFALRLSSGAGQFALRDHPHAGRLGSRLRADFLRRLR